MTISRTHRRRGPRRLMIAAAGIAAGFAFGPTPARAQDATWTATAGNSNWVIPGNWSPASVPAGTATFTNNGAATSISIAAATGGIISIGELLFTATAPATAFTLSSPNAGIQTALNLTGAGIVNNGASAPSFSINTTFFSSSNLPASLSFSNSSTAANATLALTINPAQQAGFGTLSFQDTSSAGTATITAPRQFNGQVSFRDGATAANATITINGGTLQFSGTSTAASAVITLGGGANLTFAGAALGGNARIINNGGGLVDFSGDVGPGEDSKVTTGSIEGVGNFNMPAVQLTVGGNNLSTTVSGVISATSGTPTLVKTGTGTMTLDGVNTWGGLTDVQAGTVVVGDSANPGATIAAATVETGATLAGYGTIQGNLINSGTVQPGDAVGTLTVTGNYTQNPGGSLLIAVTPTASAVLSIGGSAALAGNVTFAYAPGTYGTRSFAFLTAAGGLGGTSFATVTGTAPPGTTQAVTYSTTAATLALTGATAVVTVAAPVAQAPTVAAAAVVAVVVSPGDRTLFSAQYSAAGQLAGQTIDMLLSGDSRPPGTGPGMAGGPAVNGAWLSVSDTPMQVLGGGSSPGFNANTSRVMVGYDRAMPDNRFRAGVAAGFDETWLRDGYGGTGTQQSGRLAVYGSAALNPVIIAAALAYGHDWDSTRRVTGVGSAPESHGGDEFSGGFQAAVPVALGAFTVTPMAGVRFAALTQGAFSESGTGTLGSFVVSGAQTSFNNVVPYARVRAERRFVINDGMTIAVNGLVGYDYQAGAVAPPVSLTSVDGTVFNAASVALDRGSAVLGAGIATGRDNWSLFASYRADIAGNWYSQTALAGFRMMF